MPTAYLTTGITKSCGCTTTKSLEDHIKDCRLVHDNTYTYPEQEILESNKSKSKIKIICPIHGEFEQRLGNHKNCKQGCPKCGIPLSKGEVEIREWLLSLNPELKIECNTRLQNKEGKRFELDIYLPEYNLGIEYHGLYWHSTKFKDKSYHKEKYLFFKEKDIPLIQIFENEWVLKRDIVKSIIKSKLNLNT